VDRALILPLLFALAPALAAPPPLPDEARNRSLGVASCASSLCHGSVQPWREARALQNEYVTWSRNDRHAHAYETLLSERSTAIARKLGLAEPPQQAGVCLACHAHNVPPARRTSGFVLGDGVGCEACHGPAERWIKPHVEPGASHAKLMPLGLYPVWEPLARARLCLGCHFGNAQKLVTHRMMAAGHPRLSFEIDTFMHIQPTHYGAPRATGGEAIAQGMRVWSLGQALAALELLELFGHPTRGRDGMFPELVLFDCNACHHRMSESRNAGARLGVGPGVVRLNDANLLMLPHIVRRLDGTAADELARETARLHAAIAGAGEPLAQAVRLRGAIEKLLPRLEEHRFSEADVRAILFAVIDQGLAGQYSDYSGAEQAAMGIEALVDFMTRRGLLKVATVQRPMRELLAAAANDEAYAPERLARALRELRRAIEGEGRID
jgi:Cytochrome c554 and c-prime